MAQTEISDEKIKAYEATHYRAGVEPDVLVLRIGQHSAALALHYAETRSDCALFITAFNPLGLEQDDASNKEAHARLGEALHTIASAIIEGEGSDPSGRWRPEKSYLAFGIDIDDARDLGSRFQQDAVVWIGKDAVPKLLLLR